MESWDIAVHAGLDRYFSSRAAVYVAAGLWVWGLVNFTAAAGMHGHKRRLASQPSLRTPAWSNDDPNAADTPPKDDSGYDMQPVPFAPFFDLAGVQWQAPPPAPARIVRFGPGVALDAEGFLVEEAAAPADEFVVLVGSPGDLVHATALQEHASDADWPPARPRAGFQFGGQVLDFGARAVSAMQQAGMEWVKFQVHVGDLDATQKIEQAHARGFRVLVGLLGDQEHLLDAEYAQVFARYAGGLAASGADAIEIWNEPNTAREWPAGQIGARAYLRLLRPSYAAIKAADPGTLVVSAGLAPTLSAENLRSIHFWTEVDFSTQFVAAGGLHYLDCMGVHYNVGNAPPDATDPQLKGDAAFFYYPRLLEHYRRLTRGRRPVCFTEFGYLTDDGYPDLMQVAPDFRWARENSVDDQAAWLAQAYLSAASDPFVEMLIVWNVDFWDYGADPHAGYALLRPGGGCPACEALRLVARSGQ